jgi:pyruvate formate lyase activating enzyme
MIISGLVKLSLVDYPGKTAATVFTPGCNMRCPFCHNASLVLEPGSCESVPLDEFFAFLERRRGKLDGVCISGGEPLMQEGLEDFIRRIRDLGFLVKLDTNGAYPGRLRALLDKGLLDYVAMDVKNSPEKYAETVGVPGFDITPVLESIELLKKGSVPYEFRTTLVKGLHDIQDVEGMGRLVSGAGSYYLQSFADSGSLVGAKNGEYCPKMGAFTPEELRKSAEILEKYVNLVFERS